MEHDPDSSPPSDSEPITPTPTAAREAARARARQRPREPRASRRMDRFLGGRVLVGVIAILGWIFIVGYFTWGWRPWDNLKQVNHRIRMANMPKPLPQTRPLVLSGWYRRTPVWIRIQRVGSIRKILIDAKRPLKKNQAAPPNLFFYSVPDSNAAVKNRLRRAGVMIYTPDRILLP